MIQVTHEGRPWVVARAREKLAARARLPGAYGYDAAAHALRLARLRGLPPIELLPLALGTSWLVNNPVTSPIFRRWLTPPLAASWGGLLDRLAAAPWPELAPADREAIVAAIGAVAIEGHGAGAVSKVLALLLPEAVPLMPDAAVWFATGKVARPDAGAPDAQTAAVTVFPAMMDWFARGVSENAAALDAVAEAHATSAPLDEAQVLDRLVWFDSVGYRHFRTRTGGPAWCAVTDGGRSGIVPAPEGAAIPAADEPIDLTRGDVEPAVREAALADLQA